jgi:tetratricopeptide (TPR) repeat protein
LLGANYCLSGTVEIFGPNLTISVELSDSRTQQVVWAERIPSSIDNIHDVRAQIVNSTTAAMEIHIPLHEAGNARVLAPENLDAWNLYHLGLQHMYRFSRSDTEIAANYFERATELDPNFARAHAGRSFTSFQKAFRRNSDDIPRDKLNARKFAEKSLELDPLDPFGNFTFGRSFWLQDDADSALEWLERSVSLSPSFAKGYYAHAWTDVMAGRGAQALAHLEKSTQLSPLDPFSYAMQSSRGMAYAQKGDFENAAIWADKGARSPGSHYLIGAIAAAVHQLNNDPEKARYWVENVRSRRSDVSKVHFFQAFPFKPAADRKMWSDALTKCGI